MPSVRLPQCPSCGARLSAALSTTASCRPFCSDRCQLIDLGKWLGGAHAIPGESVPDASDDDDGA